MTDELIGKHFGGCTILDIIGVGGMAKVYRAHQLSMDRAVAVKVLPRHFLEDATYMGRFMREVRIAAQLEHRGIVPVHDYGEFEGQPYIVMRYMAGGSVDDLLAGGALALDQAVRLVEQIAPALDFAHSKGVLHRDLKPSNVLLDEQGDAFLTDFGIARIMGDSSTHVTTQGVVGTPSYMSPEQAQGGALDGRSDLYSLGVMTFEMVCGRRPFESDTPYGVAVKHVTELPPMPRQFNPALSPAVEQVILIALSKRPEERYGEASAFAEALRRAARGQTPNKDTEPSIRIRRVDMLPYAAPTPKTGTPYPPPLINAPPTPPDFNTAPPPRPRGGVARLIMSAGVGVLIGCGLLAALVVVGLLVIVSLTAIEPTAAPSDDAAAGTALSTATVQRSLVTVTRAVSRTSAPTATAIPQTPRAAAPPVDLEAARVVYAAESEGSFDLYSIPLAGGKPARLTDDPAADLAPALSPDGRRIAFISDRDGDFDLYLIGIDGGRALRPLDTAVAERSPVWSADGERLYVASDVRGDGGGDIFSLRPDGSDLRLLYATAGRCGDLASAPDGGALVFVCGEARDASTWEIMRLDLLTGSSQRLTRNRTKESAPFVLADGSILYTTEGDGYSGIALMDADGGERRILYDGPGYDWGGRLTVGDLLLFTSDVSGRDAIYVLDWTQPLSGAPRLLVEGIWGSLALG